jgi:hypothetical protein
MHTTRFVFFDFKTIILNLIFIFYVIPLAWADEPVGYVHRDEDLGVSIRLPGPEWKLTDESQIIATVRVFSPVENLSTRATLLRLPGFLFPRGMADREAQLQGALRKEYRRLSLGPGELAGRVTERLEYATDGFTTIEEGWTDGDFFCFFQLAGPDSAWNDEELRRPLDSIRESFEFIERAEPAASSEPETPPAVVTPEDIRARRQTLQEARRESVSVIIQHELLVELEPTSGSLRIRDRLTLEAPRDDFQEFKLAYSPLVTLEKVSAPEKEISWEVLEDTQGYGGALVVKFAGPLKKGEKTLLEVEGFAADFFSAVDQKLIAEVAVLGQVREKSSYSSHVAYYPIDDVNDAAMDMTLLVPAGWSAVTGGKLVESGERDGKAFFRYVFGERRPRELPFGFAAAPSYISETGHSNEGLELVVYGYAGEEELVRQRVAAAVEAANVFERMMGPLPWPLVRFAHVSPERKEMGVSLPGLILISDGFFGDLAGVDLSDGNLNRKDGLDLLLIADELSHQWNFYATPLPNELAEGISTFTNLLFIEERHGREAYWKGVDFCRDAYKTAVSVLPDAAIADPNIYETEAYRAIAFCKTPAVLAMLRDEVGEGRFFRAWREFFQEHDGSADAYEKMEEVFSRVAERDLSAFFEQWFFRTGWPKVKASLLQKNGLWMVKLQQTSTPLYQLSVEVLLRSAQGEEYRLLAALVEEETLMELPAGTLEPAEILLDPDGRLLADSVAVSEPAQPIAFE